MTTTRTSAARTPEATAPSTPSGADAAPRGHIAWVVVGSLATGLVVASVLVFAPFIAAEENDITGAVLCGFAVGWAMLAVLSVRFTDQPQRWAAVPAMVMGVSGLLLITVGSSLRVILDWLWPPAMLALSIWMIVQAHKHLQSRTRWLIYPISVLLGLGALGGGYETLGGQGEAKGLSMPGTLIEVSGHKLHLHCTGSGSPTVVLQAGGGEMSSNLGWITPVVANTTSVCVYDRAGRGWSEPADTVQDGTQIASDLYTLLQGANVPGPYVMAGHSFGGLYTLRFAALYPDEIAGMVLVDPTAPAPTASTAPARATAESDTLRRLSTLGSVSARLA